MQFLGRFFYAALTLIFVSLVSCSKRDIVTPVMQVAQQTSELTKGWQQEAYQVNIQTPYNLPVGDRYSFDANTNTHSFWVYKADKPHDSASSTRPRSEMMIKKVYTSGLHQFEADVKIDSATDASCISQIHGGASSSTSFMAFIYQAQGNTATLRSYDNSKVQQQVEFNSWWHLNIIHDADNHQISVYYNNKLIGTYTDGGQANHYFKCGVYSLNSPYAKASFRNVRYFSKQ